MDIITSHINADFDSLASMVAAKKLYPKAEIVFPGSQEKKLRDFLEVFHPTTIKRIKDIDLSKVTRLIIVDTKLPGRIGPLAELLSNKNIKIHIYDHHPFSKGDIRGEVEVIEKVGATATIFAEMLKNKKLHPAPMEATILALGIYEETGCLLFPSTTERDLLAAAYLLKRGANLNIASSFLKMEMSMEEFDVLNELVQSSKEFVIQGIRIKIGKASREQYVGDAAHFAHRMMDMEDIDAVIILLSMDGKILMVARSKVPELDVSKVMKEFGGGHPTAASATIKEASLEVVEERLIDMLDSSVKPGKVAADIMTRPVISVQSDVPVKDAESMMTRYGVNVLPVLEGETYAGLISREIVEKALFHGFGKSRAIDFSTPDAIIVDPSAPIRMIETLMIEQNQRFMPVVEDGRIIGAITRTDLLRTLYEEFLRRRRIEETVTKEKPTIGRNLSSWLKDKFPPEVYDLLKLSGEVAEELGFGAYIVGGSVRDLLRGESNLDIDIVIEGDGISFARAFGERLRAKVRTHQKFATAQIITDKMKLDVATARTEYYESPAALPKVETSSIKKDLYRRDFTINTLAIKLNPRDFGFLIDFFGGQRDLREKAIRVLHNLSFVEDPTRAFRAVRFSERFGFKISRHTENLIKSAIEMNLFNMLSGPRLYEELRLAFHETEPIKTLRKLSDMGLLKVINPSLVFTIELETTLKAMQETLSWFNLLFLEEKTDKGVLYLMALLAGLKEEDIKAVVDRLAPPPKVREVILQGIPLAKDILRKFPTGDPVEIHKLLSNLKLEVVLVLMALSKDREKQKMISHYLTELRNVKTIFKGEDLKRMGIHPGPVYSKILTKLLEEKLRGNLKTREDEEKFVKEFVKG